MGVSANVHTLARDKLHRPEMVKEDERPDHLPFAVRQSAPDREGANVAAARDDDQFERVARGAIAEDGVEVGLPAHGRIRRA